MKISKTKLANDIAALLGESLTLECESGESPFPGLADRIVMLTPLVLGNLFMESSHELLTGWKTLAVSFTADATGKGILLLPEDFLRLGGIKLSGWNDALNHITAETEPQYAWIKSKWEGIRGSPQRPVAVTAVTTQGERCLEIYGCSAGDTLEKGWYLPVPAFEGDSIEIPPALYADFLKKMHHALCTYFKMNLLRIRDT